ncbi:MAG TPA: threonine synthase [Gemmatimonadaceae bacterium]|jgi:threonine synthase|nr:threonine synthase [Gemmatimonadaceae bacterium]
MHVKNLECSFCHREYEARRVHNVCTECGKPIFVRYDLKRISKFLTRQALYARRADLWRYREVLPVRREDNIVTLGEGWTPLHHAKHLGETLGMGELYIKDESVNPTQSFKARGMAVAVSMAKELGLKKLAAPSAGNAAGALAAYCALAGIEAHLFMPRDTPRANIIECEVTGANVTLIDGLITDCGAEVARRKEAEGWFDVSTLKEPYRVEGKKTLGYELAEQGSWTLPDVIIYPTGGGTGLVGMWKAFDEMQELGWIDDKRPRMISVQAAGCAPIVRAFEKGERNAGEFENAATIASGLRVPKAIGDFLILDAIRESNGAAIAVSDEELIAGAREIARREGIFAAPEGGACLPALRKLIDRGKIKLGERVVLFNTGSGIKYLDAFDAEVKARTPRSQRKSALGPALRT